MSSYSNYDDWYDNGPGSESFKREIQKDYTEYLQTHAMEKISWMIRNLKEKERVIDLPEELFEV